MSELLRVKGLSKSFGRKPVLKDFDLTVESGRVYGLLGCNGEGKTTLARILMGSSRPTQERSRTRAGGSPTARAPTRGTSATSPKTRSSTTA